MDFTPDTTLTEIQDYLMENMTKAGGVKCPCCEKNVHVDTVALSATMVKLLHILYEKGPDKSFVESKAVHNTARDRGIIDADTGGTFAKLRHWGLTSPMKGRKPENGSARGQWRITQRGIDFLKRDIGVEKSVYLYKAMCLGKSDEIIMIEDAMGEHFSLYKTMGPVDL